MIYADSDCILVPEADGKQNLEESYTSKYQKYIPYSYGYKLLCVNDKFSKPFKTYLDNDPVYKFINNMIEESISFSEVMKKHFHKELAVTKEKN